MLHTSSMYRRSPDLEDLCYFHLQWLESMNILRFPPPPRLDLHGFWQSHDNKSHLFFDIAEMPVLITRNKRRHILCHLSTGRKDDKLKREEDH